MQGLEVPLQAHHLICSESMDSDDWAFEYVYTLMGMTLIGHRKWGNVYQILDHALSMPFRCSTS